jgi:uracil-DNA glycosylase
MTLEEKILGEGWAAALSGIFTSHPLKELKSFLQAEIHKGYTVYPKFSQIFRAFELTPLENVRIVFVGQDPYHGAGQAEGLCFSVAKNMPLPPSLRNIFQELQSDLKISPPKHGSLVSWAKQGCFMLNTRLTVRDGVPLSHNHPGWDYFSTQVFQALDKKSAPILFVLLGSHAQKLKELLKNPIHEYFMAPHPSPLSAYRGFLGSKLFSRMNSFLRKHRYDTIEWAHEYSEECVEI